MAFPSRPKNWVKIFRTHDSGCEWGKGVMAPFLLIALGRHWLAGAWSSWPSSLDTLESYRPMRHPVVPPTPKGGHLRNNDISGIRKPTQASLTQKTKFTSFLTLPSPPIVFGVELWLYSGNKGNPSTLCWELDVNALDLPSHIVWGSGHSLLFFL